MLSSGTLWTGYFNDVSLGGPRDIVAGTFPTITTTVIVAACGGVPRTSMFLIPTRAIVGRGCTIVRIYYVATSWRLVKVACH